MHLLGDYLHAWADTWGYVVYTMVNEGNVRALRAFKRAFGYENAPVVMLMRKPR